MYVRFSFNSTCKSYIKSSSNKIVSVISDRFSSLGNEIISFFKLLFVSYVSNDPSIVNTLQKATEDLNKLLTNF